MAVWTWRVTSGIGAMIGTISRTNSAFCAAVPGTIAMKTSSARHIEADTIQVVSSVTEGFVSCCGAPVSLCPFTLYPFHFARDAQGGRGETDQGGDGQTALFAFRIDKAVGWRLEG